MNVELPMCLLNWINPDKINWCYLSSNTSEGAMQLLETNLDRINRYCWEKLSVNPSAIQLLEKIKIKYIGESCLKIRQKVLYSC